MTKGQRKAEKRRRLRKRGTGDLTRMLGKLARANYGMGPKTKNARHDSDEFDEVENALCR